MKYAILFFALLGGISITLPLHPEIAESAASYVRDEKWALERAIEGFLVPVAVAVDKEGNIHVSNRGRGTVTRIDREGGLKELGMKAPAGSPFDFLRCLVLRWRGVLPVDKDGEMYAPGSPSLFPRTPFAASNKDGERT